MFFNGGCWGIKMDKCSDKIFHMSEQHIFCYHILEFLPHLGFAVVNASVGRNGENGAAEC